MFCMYVLLLCVVIQKAKNIFFSYKFIEVKSTVHKCTNTCFTTNKFSVCQAVPLRACSSIDACLFEVSDNVDSCFPCNPL